LKLSAACIGKRQPLWAGMGLQDYRPMRMVVVSSRLREQAAQYRCDPGDQVRFCV